MPRVAHVITTLNVGGAERLLADVIAHGSDAVLVVNLSRPGPVSDEIRDLGVEVVDLGLRRVTDLPRAVRRLIAELRRAAPDVIQTWMYHADLLGGFAARRAGVPALAWSLHASDLPRDEVRRRTLALRRVAARLSSRWPDVIVCTSEATREVHEKLGYDAGRMRVIRNGFRVPEHDPQAGAVLRRQLGIGPEAMVVARVARLDPQKDWSTFAAAMVEVLRTHPDVYVIGCGRDVTPEAPQLRDLAGEFGDRVHLLGLRDDVAVIHAAADVAVSSSAFGETHPLAIGEAMAAGVPVVTTDVGDCRELVGDTGVVVIPGDAVGLREEVVGLLEDPERHRRLGLCARERVVRCFDIKVTAHHYHELHQELAGVEGGS